VKIVALVADLMDRSRIDSALGPVEQVGRVEFTNDATAVAGADLVLVDLARFGDVLSAVRDAAPLARIVAFGPHVDDEAMVRARADGAAAVMARSRFFRDVRAAAFGTATDR